jgi:hypothetical protein
MSSGRTIVGSAAFAFVDFTFVVFAFVVARPFFFAMRPSCRNAPLLGIILADNVA